MHQKIREFHLSFPHNFAATTRHRQIDKERGLWNQKKFRTFYLRSDQKKRGSNKIERMRGVEGEKREGENKGSQVGSVDLGLVGVSAFNFRERKLHTSSVTPGGTIKQKFSLLESIFAVGLILDGPDHFGD